MEVKGGPASWLGQGKLGSSGGHYDRVCSRSFFGTAGAGEDLSSGTPLGVDALGVGADDPGGRLGLGVEDAVGPEGIDDPAFAVPGMLLDRD